jgi:hypothetical protein
MRLLRPVRVRPLLGALAISCLFGLVALPASAKILIEIDKSAQRMVVSQDGAQLYEWPVSTGLRSYETPSGEYMPFRMERDHFSREWDDAPMPHSIFFTRQGHAIHGTEHLRNIGRPASHGCVRLEPENARVLFEMVKAEGVNNVRVVLFGPTPGRDAPVARRGGSVDPRTGYVEHDGDEDFTGAGTRRGRERDERRGYWVRRYEGPRVYYQREPDFYRPSPPPFYGPRGPWGWN